MWGGGGVGTRSSGWGWSSWHSAARQAPAPQPGGAQHLADNARKAWPAWFVGAGTAENLGHKKLKPHADSWWCAGISWWGVSEGCVSCLCERPSHSSIDTLNQSSKSWGGWKNLNSDGALEAGLASPALGTMSLSRAGERKTSSARQALPPCSGIEGWKWLYLKDKAPCLNPKKMVKYAAKSVLAILSLETWLQPSWTEFLECLPSMAGLEHPRKEPAGPWMRWALPPLHPLPENQPSLPLRDRRKVCFKE